MYVQSRYNVLCSTPISMRYIVHIYTQNAHSQIESNRQHLVVIRQMTLKRGITARRRHMMMRMRDMMHSRAECFRPPPSAGPRRVLAILGSARTTS